jgi:HAD superfamily hydrolase (TIGR01509 family)
MSHKTNAMTLGGDSLIEKITPTGAIFDMDGLMLDTERPSLRAWKKAGERMGFSIPEEVAFRTIGIPKEAVRKVYLDAFGEDFPYHEIRATVKQLLDEEVQRQGVALRPGLLVLLDTFAGMGVPLAVATSTHKSRALWKLDHTGLRSRFAAFAFGDEVEHGKPAPDIFLLAAERLGKNPRDCVGFEDSPAGLTGLHAAGIRSVFVKDLVEPPEETLATVWRRAQDLAEAAAFFE